MSLQRHDIVFFLATGLMWACGQDAKKGGKPADRPAAESGPTADETSESEKKASASKGCQAPEGSNTRPKTVSELVTLINGLPMPVTIPCLVQVLPSDMALAATTSTLSVQPALGADAPRIFVNLGALTLAVVPSATSALEVAEEVDERMSVKAEIIFPVTAPLVASAPYAHLLDASSSKTSCGGFCHFGETFARSEGGVSVFASKRLRPTPSKDMDLPSLKRLADGCQDATTPRCQVLRAFFQGKSPQAYAFPLDLPTF